MRAWCIALALATTSCGTTRIHSERGSTVVVNGVAGRGEVEIRRRGAPSTASISVRGPEGRKAGKQIRRKFGVGTFFIGWFTMGVGWIFAWEYPEEVYVELPPGLKSAGWGHGADPWTAPPKSSWNPRTVPPPAAAPKTVPQSAPEPVPPPAAVPETVPESAPEPVPESDPR